MASLLGISRSVKTSEVIGTAQIEPWGSAYVGDIDDLSVSVQADFEPKVDFSAKEKPKFTKPKSHREVHFEERKQDHRTDQRVRDPYDMHPNQVHIRDFIDARVHNPDIAPGFVVQRHVAKAAYRRWLCALRNVEGWDKFRRERVRPERPDMSVIYIGTNVGVTIDEHGRPYDEETVQKRMFARNQTRKQDKASAQGARHQVASSKEKGVGADDEDYRPKTFTKKMGSAIAECRLGLGDNQADLARKANIDVGTLRAIERGDHPFNPEDTVVKSLAKALGLQTIKYQE
jgi:DNA-binding XRE family transcriptional regulator